jgi:signal transduction histidine kinase
VADDGPGCVRILPSLGIRGMEERVRLAEGELLLDGSDGFTVRTVLPRRGD